MEETKVVGKFDVVILGGSAGSLQVLMKILPLLNVQLPFAFVIVLHRKSTEDKTLEQLIDLKSTVNVREVEDKVLLVPGNIYIAPSNYHLLFEKDNYISLDASEKVNYSRPSIDVSFESAAEVYKSKVLGILLSGANADGTKGMQIIKEMGGTIIAQDPETAETPFMPLNAIKFAKPDYILTVEEIIDFINSIQ